MTEFLDSIGYGQWILHALVVLPLLGLVPVLLGPETSAKWTALLVTAVEFVLSLGLWWALDPTQAGGGGVPARNQKMPTEPMDLLRVAEFHADGFFPSRNISVVQHPLLQKCPGGAGRR